jgi:hypothetical protein
MAPPAAVARELASGCSPTMFATALPSPVFMFLIDKNQDHQDGQIVFYGLKCKLT